MFDGLGQIRSLRVELAQHGLATESEEATEFAETPLIGSSFQTIVESAKVSNR